MTREVLDEWYSYYHQCSECRRCSVFCPYGIDTAEVTMAAREIMDSVGLGQKYSNEIIGKVHKIGNNLGLPGPALENTLEGLEEDVKDDTGVDVRYPIDVKGAEVLLITPSADFFAEPHVESLIGYGKVFHAAGISWTLSSMASEAGNFGMFIGNYEQLRKIALRIREAALELGVKRIVVGECGHAWRVAYSFWNTLVGIGAGGRDPFAIQLQSQLDSRYKQPTHICELTYDLIQRGALRFDKDKNDDRIITFHDSCNVARASRMGDMPGGQFVIPREIIKAVANNFHDMAPGTIGEATFCCGGGGGLLTDDLIELRVKGALPRMEALKNVVDQHGVNFMATICAICKAQFTKVLPYYGAALTGERTRPWPTSSSWVPASAACLRPTRCVQRFRRSTESPSSAHSTTSSSCRRTRGWQSAGASATRSRSRSPRCCNARASTSSARPSPRSTRPAAG